MKISYKDKIFPNQDFNKEIFYGEGDYITTLFNFLNTQDKEIIENQNNFIFEEHKRVPFEEMSTPPMQVGFLKFIMNMVNGKSFLEIGTFLGSTSMHIAKAMGPSANVITIEKFKEFSDIAKKNIERNNLSDQITVINGDALKVIETLNNNSFDLIYVDGDKGKYLDITKIAESKLKNTGIIIVDDIFFHGDTLNNPPSTEKGLGCKKTVDYYLNCEHMHKYLLPVNNGILLLKPKS